MQCTHMSEREHKVGFLLELPDQVSGKKAYLVLLSYTITTSVIVMIGICLYAQCSLYCIHSSN